MADCAAPIIAVFLAGKVNAIAQENAAALIAGLASDVRGVSAEQLAANQAAILDCGGIAPLVKLLRSEDASRGAKRHTALALAQLACGLYGTPQTAIAEAGGVHALVEWLATPTLGPPEEAAHALSKIGAKNYQTQLTILEADAIPFLVAMLNLGEPVESRQWALEALAALAEENAVSQIMIAEEGGIAPLVALLKDADPRPHEHATRALCRLAANPDNRLGIAAAGALAPLVAIIKEEEEGSASADSGSETRQRWGAAALEALARDCLENHATWPRAQALEILQQMNISVQVSAEPASLRMFHERMASIGSGLGTAGATGGARRVSGTQLNLSGMRNLIEQASETATGRPLKSKRSTSSSKAGGSRLRLRGVTSGGSTTAGRSTELAGKSRAPAGAVSPASSPKQSPKAATSGNATGGGTTKTSYRRAK